MSPEGRLYRAVADPTRRALLDVLLEGEKSAGELAARFATSRPSISKHVRLLRDAHLVDERREGRHRYYTLRPDPLAEIDQWIRKYRVFWTSRLERLKAYVEEDPA